MPRKPAIPSYRLHKASGQAVVTLGGRDHYLGRHDTQASLEAYERAVLAWRAHGAVRPRSAPPLSVAGLVVAYWQHVERAGLYMKNGRKTSERSCLAVALRPLVGIYGTTPAADFGPRDLLAVREALCSPVPAEPGEKRRRVHVLPIARKSVNSHVHRIRRVFRWAASMQLVPAPTWQALESVEALRRGQVTTARETGDVRPAPLRPLARVLRDVPAATAALIRFQWFTGCRPGEAVQVRLGDIERKGSTWIYRPGSHKTEHHGIVREIVVGPRAQKVLAPFLSANPSAYLFPGRHGGHVAESSYAKSIARACDRLGIVGADRWTPGQLRHNAATRIRRRFGLDGARTVLGHGDATTTAIYAERDIGKAVEIATAMG